MIKISRLFPLFLIPLLAACAIDSSKKEIVESPSTPFDAPPAWAKEVVWYQIFVERFRNGDPDNDPTPEDMEGAYPGFVPEGWKITPWTQDWFRPDDYFANMDGKQGIGGHPITGFDQKLQARRYGGDLQGVLDQMDYLQELGVTAIYFNPLNDAPSLHKYDARHWRHIDRNFGPNPAKDRETMANEDPTDPDTWEFTEADKMFLKVIEEFHKRGIKVILDYSWNHTGHTFWAWKDVLKNQEKSPFAEWYEVKQFDDPNTPEDEFEFSGWAGVPDLPEIKKTQYMDHADGIRAYEGNLYSQEVKEHIFAITRRWMDPNGDGDPSDGVDGFRLDVAAEVPLGFWREYRKVVREVNPDALLLGEVWWEQWPETMIDPEPFLRGDIFDSNMNYRWYRAARHFFNAAPDELPASAFVDSLEFFRHNLREESNYALMNLTASHDVPRTLTSLFNKTKNKYQAKPEDNPDYKIHKPDEATYATLRMLLAQQFTYIGAPHIYAGDEMGMWGPDDPGNRKPLIWKDYDFEPESTHPLGKDRPTDEVKFDEELFSYYQKLIGIRADNPALVHGSIDFILTDDGHKLLAYSRKHDSEEVIAVFNAGNETQIINLPTKNEGSYEDVLGGIEVRREGENLVLELPGRTAAVLVGE
ncbi:alpha-glucosidase C-terminal domain-containing protein [Litoribacter alkaliphilus]|uniref:Alpha-glucosidase C-terminal domain-containing protein n=1 Tax=Litoribacter ruber TaxID=702568 RepID=A0AAP2G4A0_9BACT|nr:glycoside hydrolase family 13 protein [Litoribacter alkaliphilus]MBS9523821.1 alpha-glucosidase C-terminal domain-containing protein [Litoribacter alkaliphilus]